MNESDHNQIAIVLEADAEVLLEQAKKFGDEGEKVLGIAYYQLSISQEELANLHRLEHLRA